MFLCVCVVCVCVCVCVFVCLCTGLAQTVQKKYDVIIYVVFKVPYMTIYHRIRILMTVHGFWALPLLPTCFIALIHTCIGVCGS